MGQHSKKFVVLANLVDRTIEHDGMIILTERHVADVCAVYGELDLKTVEVHRLAETITVSLRMSGRLEDGVVDDDTEQALLYLADRGKITLPDLDGVEIGGRGKHARQSAAA